MNEIIEFLKEYEKLCQKYKMGLRGCGCCGSPWLDYKKEDKLGNIDEINYEDELNRITIDDKTLDIFIKEMENNNE